MLVVQLIVLSTLSVVKYIDKDFCLQTLKHGRSIISFLVGAAITLLFTQVLNEAYKEIHKISDLLILILPFTFYLSMVFKNHIKNHSGFRAKKEKSLYASILSFVSGIILGMIVFSTVSESIVASGVLLSTLLIYELVSDLSIHIYHKKTFGKKHVRIKQVLLAASPFYGFAIGALTKFGQIFSVSLIIAFSGAFLYIILEEIFPREGELNMNNFLQGMVTLSALFLLNL